jgi:hypothetical protein
MPKEMSQFERQRHNGCEWSPLRSAPAYDDDAHFLTTKAVWSVGGKPNFHLCEACVTLPRFRRMKKTRLRAEMANG